MEKIRLAVAGAGLIGRRHIELVGENPRCRLVAICDPSETVADAARTLDVPLYATLEALLENEALDGVILATPNRLHVDHALLCIDAGVAALIEKPVADTISEGERLCARACDSHVPLLVGHHRLHSPIVEQARRIIDSGRLGNLVGVQGSAIFYKPADYFDQAPWRRQPGGGPILINMVHEIGSLRALCGEIVAVQALASRARRGFPVEDTVSINLRFAGGALGTFLLSDTAASARSWEQTSQENAAYPSYPDEDCYVISGDMGSLSVPSMRLKTYSSQADRSWWRPFDMTVEPVTHADPLKRQLDHFCDVIAGTASPRVTVEDALQNVRVAEAIAQAAKSGTVIELQILETTG